MLSTIQIVLIVILAAGGIAIGLLGESLGLHPSSTGAFTGALIAAAAAMLGAWLTWLRQQGDKASADAERRDKIKLLVEADLAFVFGRYVSLQRLLQAAKRTMDAGATSPTPDFSSVVPRSMPYTSNFGTELLMLSRQEIDVLSTLTSEIAITQIRLQDFITGQRRFDAFSISSLCQEVARDLIILALAFEAIAPSREFTVENQPLERASAQLRRLAAELKPNPLEEAFIGRPPR